jgi:hypothetical protein
MTPWHLDRATAVQFVEGELAMAFAASAEAHLIACAQCRELLTAAADRPRLDRIWAGVAERVNTPRPGIVERVLRSINVREDTARLLAATPSLRGSWLLALLAVLAFAALAASADERGALIFLTIAPILPVAGVAVAFSRYVDPAHEIGLAAPYSGFRLLLLRSTAVVGTTCVAATAAGLAGAGLTATAWLLPALALAATTLALTRWLDVAVAAVALGVLWLVTVALTQLGTERLVLFGLAGQLVCLTLAVISLSAIVAGRDRYLIQIGGKS